MTLSAFVATISLLKLSYTMLVLGSPPSLDHNTAYPEVKREGGGGGGGGDYPLRSQENKRSYDHIRRKTGGGHPLHTLGTC